MANDFFAPGRARVVRNVLFAILGLAGVLVLLGLLFVVTGDEQGGVLVLVIAAVYALMAGLSLRAIGRRSPTARRTVVATAIVVIVLSLLIVGIFVGLLTVIAGVGLLAVTFAPEQEGS